jgi:hypothetical protein
MQIRALLFARVVAHTLMALKLTLVSGKKPLMAQLKMLVD